MKDEKFEKLLGHPRIKRDFTKIKDGNDSEEVLVDKFKKNKTAEND